MEGWFWRFSDAASGRVAVVLCGLCRGRAGNWTMVSLATSPGGFVRTRLCAPADVDAAGRSIDVPGGVLRARPFELRVDLGPDARLDVAFADRVGWPARRAFGGIGAAQVLPGLSQYWHPHLLGARVAGAVRAGGHDIALDGATAYAEKNWGAGGHPPAWWWGQAHGFDRADACVAFAGGHAALGPLAVRNATSVVVALGGDVLRLVTPPLPLRVAEGEDGWRLRGRTPLHRVEIEGRTGGRAPHLLPVPFPADRHRHEEQSAMHLAGELRVRVRRGARTIFAGTSSLAGLERGLGPVSPPAGPPGA